MLKRGVTKFCHKYRSEGGVLFFIRLKAFDMIHN